MHIVSYRILTNRVAQDIEQHFVINRLFEKVERTAFHGEPCGLDVAVCRQHDHRQGNSSVEQRPLKLESVHGRHLQIRENTASPLRTIRLKKCLRGGEKLRAHAFQRQQETQRVADGRVVVDQEHSCIAHIAGSGDLRGNSIRKRAPLVPVASSRSSPPWLLSNEREIASPNPIPSRLCVTNGSNNWSRISADTPQPESSTITFNRAPSVTTAMCTRRCPGATSASASRALASKLCSTICSWIPSVETSRVSRMSRVMSAPRRAA